MLGNCDVITFITTRDAARARAFYETVLGLRLLADEPAALVFDAHGVMLRIAKVQQVVRVPNTVLGWKVADIAATVEGLRQKGVEFQRYEGMRQDVLGVWTSPSGARVAWFLDPDGNTLSLTQFP